MMARPKNFLQLVETIPEKEELIDFIYDKMKKKETEPASISNVGYVILDNAKMQKIFQPLFDKLKIKPTISYVYIHFTGEDGNFSTHWHDKPHAVYYLQIPIPCGQLYFDEFDQRHQPVENQLLIIPTNVKHSILRHGNKIPRIAVTMQLENIGDGFGS